MKEKEQFPRIIPRVSKGAAGLLALCLILILVFGLSGCSGRGSLKDNVLDGFNDLLLYFSDQALTEDKDLHGTRIAGEDSYTGTYTGDYEGFSGKEYLFGGTSLAREKGKNLITFTLPPERPGFTGERKKLPTPSPGTPRMVLTLFPSPGEIITLPWKAKTLPGH